MQHLTPLLVSKAGTLGYATTYSAGILKYWQQVSILPVEKLLYKQLINALTNYQRVEKVTVMGEFQLKGDIVSVWLIGYDKPVRIEFFGDRAEKAYQYDEVYGRAGQSIKQLVVSDYPLTDEFDLKQIVVDSGAPASADQVYIFTNAAPESLVATEIIKTDYTFPQLFFSRHDLLSHELARLESLNYEIGIFTRQSAALPSELEKYIINNSTEAFAYQVELLRKLPAGFESSTKKQLLLTDREIFGTIHLAPAEETDSSKTIRLLRQLEEDIKIGDYIVHEDYGVGIYKGLVQEKNGNQLDDYLALEYAKSDQLFVPIAQITKLTRYITDSTLPPKLTRIGKAEWESVKQKVKKSVGIMARELIAHYAKRQVATAPQIADIDSVEYEKFASEFSYELTADQHRSINEILFDITQSKPMNRLLIGDVGFGKTEVFLRTAFKMAEQGKQVAILCPTTVLSAQHFALCKKRFAGTDFRIASLSRFNTSKENRAIVDKLNAGEIDIVIGTHRLLSNDVKFKDLGLLVVDEEQKFGVKQKEKIKKLNYGVHLLSVTATPIPRTLSMALSTIQDISIISTPPQNRLSVHTELIKNDWNVIAAAISKEIKRGGQVYFIHNVVQTIQSITQRLQTMLPGISFVFAHGQMPVSQLDKIVTDFFVGKYQVLVATTIIENGIDMPNVNTMIVNQAHKFGLSQLYQLRGRVGRSQKQAFCYLFYEGSNLGSELPPEVIAEDKKVKPKAYLERLQAIMNATDLGSGFKLASRDLEIRGAGNLLGDEQSGHINTVGYSLYMQMLAREIGRLEEGIEGTVLSF